MTQLDLDAQVVECSRELGFDPPAPGEARAFVVTQWARLVAQGKVEPDRGAKRIWLLSNEWWGKPEWDRLSIFVGVRASGRTSTGRGGLEPVSEP